MILQSLEEAGSARSQQKIVWGKGIVAQRSLHTYHAGATAARQTTVSCQLPTLLHAVVRSAKNEIKKFRMI